MCNKVRIREEARNLQHGMGCSRKKKGELHISESTLKRFKYAHVHQVRNNEHQVCPLQCNIVITQYISSQHLKSHRFV